MGAQRPLVRPTGSRQWAPSSKQPNSRKSDSAHELIVLYSWQRLFSQSPGCVAWSDYCWQTHLFLVSHLSLVWVWASAPRAPAWSPPAAPPRPLLQTAPAPYTPRNSRWQLSVERSEHTPRYMTSVLEPMHTSRDYSQLLLESQCLIRRGLRLRSQR